MKRMKGIDPARITWLNAGEPQPHGAYVLYWMQQSQRAHENPALEFAIQRANRLDVPVLVCFGLMDGYPEANRRHYRFMLEGLVDTMALLGRRRILLVVRRGPPPEVAVELTNQAALVVCDVGYTRHQREWRQTVARAVPCPVAAVEGDVVVPVALAAPKAEYAARTFRPKLLRHLDAYLCPCPRYRPKHGSLDLPVKGLSLENLDALLDRLAIDQTVAPVTRYFRGGPSEAKRRLRRFISHRLARYSAHRNQPQSDAVSTMSPYLHFGQISPVYLALRIRDTVEGAPADREAYLEELVVRRELAVNFLYYTPAYDGYQALPNWAQKSLAEHSADPRPTIYPREVLETATSHDPYWNAAMKEMLATGYLHNHMRMYWGKKILEWSATPEVAFETTLQLNNKYLLDGRDANSYAGVGWVFGLHDRAWFEREIFGKVRYMAASGLERKCDIKAYVEKVNRHTERAEGVTAF
jgi:deoxyribodipyrimidine photo-lyase